MYGLWCGRFGKNTTMYDSGQMIVRNCPSRNKFPSHKLSLLLHSRQPGYNIAYYPLTRIDSFVHCYWTISSKTEKLSSRDRRVDTCGHFSEDMKQLENASWTATETFLVLSLHAWMRQNSTESWFLFAKFKCCLLAFAALMEYSISARRKERRLWWKP